MWQFAQYSTSGSSGSVVSALVLLILATIFFSMVIAAIWKIFTKAGQAGWKSLIPIYNVVIELRIVGLSGWFVLLYFIPIVNFFLAIFVAYKLSKSFGYGIGMTILQFLFIGTLILGFGKAKYLGSDGKGGVSPQSPQTPLATGSQPPIVAGPQPPAVPGALPADIVGFPAPPVSPTDQLPVNQTPPPQPPAPQPPTDPMPPQQPPLPPTPPPPPAQPLVQ